MPSVLPRVHASGATLNVAKPCLGSFDVANVRSNHGSDCGPNPKLSTDCDSRRGNAPSGRAIHARLHSILLVPGAAIRLSGLALIHVHKTTCNERASDFGGLDPKKPTSRPAARSPPWCLFAELSRWSISDRRNRGLLKSERLVSE